MIYCKDCSEQCTIKCNKQLRFLVYFSLEAKVKQLVSLYLTIKFNKSFISDFSRLNKEVTAAREALATLKPQAGAATPMMMNATPSHTPAPQTPVRTGGETPAAGQMADDSTEETGSRFVSLHCGSFTTLFTRYTILFGKENLQFVCSDGKKFLF